jgi:hypothetical protein
MTGHNLCVVVRGVSSRSWPAAIPRQAWNSKGDSSSILCSMFWIAGFPWYLSMRHKTRRVSPFTKRRSVFPGVFSTMTTARLMASYALPDGTAVGAVPTLPGNQDISGSRFGWLGRPAPYAAAEGGGVNHSVVGPIEFHALDVRERKVVEGLPGPAVVTRQPEARPGGAFG